MATIYHVNGLGYWNADTQKFIESTVEADTVLEVGIAEGEGKIEALKNLLSFDGYPIDKLDNEGSRLEILVNENKDFILNMFILTSLDQEIPDAAMERFEALRNQISTYSGAAKLNLLGM